MTFHRLICVILPVLLLSACGQTVSPPAASLEVAPALQPASSEEKPELQPPEIPALEGMGQSALEDAVLQNDIAIGEDIYTIRRTGRDAEFVDYPVLDRVEVFRNGDYSAPVQVFTDFTYDADPPLDGELVVEDLDFDGWPDFRIFSYQARIGSGWFYWCWDPETGEFVLQDELENLNSPVVEPEERTIYSSQLYGPGGFTCSAWQWEDGELKETRCFSVLWEEERLVNRWYVRRDGELCLEREWYAEDWETYGDAMVVPEAEEYLALVQPGNPDN